MPALPDVGRFRPAPPAAPPPAQLGEAARRLREARRPVILAGRASRDAGAWRARVALAERVGATVLTDLKAPAAFPTAHPLHGAPPGYFLTPPATARLREADVVLSLDWIDLAGTLRQAWGGAPVSATIVQVSADHHVHHGFAMDHQALPPADLWLPVDPDAPSRRSSRRLPEAPGPSREAGVRAATPAARWTAMPSTGRPGGALRHAVAGLEPTLIRVPLGWSGAWDVAGPLDHLRRGRAAGSARARDGGRGGAGAPGERATAGRGPRRRRLHGRHRAVDRRPLPDRSSSVVANNRSCFNDELHQSASRGARPAGRQPLDRPAHRRSRGRPRRDGPGPGLVGSAVASRPELPLALARAVAAVREGAPCVVDVHVRPGYGPAMTQAMARGAAPR
jgi:hypothetical protein